MVEAYTFFDTQVISYTFKQAPNATEIQGGAISSIVASEFLLMQCHDPKKANYYIPMLPHLRLPTVLHNGLIHINKISPLKKTLIDSVVMEFGHDYEPIVEYSNLALASVINNKQINLFYSSITHLDKILRKNLRKRYQFLLDNELQCMPLNKGIINLAFLLLQDFTKQHNVKQNFRNSWNDMLILATALFFHAELITKDNELNRFAAEHLARSFKHDGPFLQLSFENTELTARQLNRESKGYINYAWKADFHHYK